MAYVKRRTLRSKKRKARKTKRIKGGMNGSTTATPTTEQTNVTKSAQGGMNGSTTGTPMNATETPAQVVIEHINNDMNIIVDSVERINYLEAIKNKINEMKP